MLTAFKVVSGNAQQALCAYLPVDGSSSVWGSWAADSTTRPSWARPPANPFAASPSVPPAVCNRAQHTFPVLCDEVRVCGV